MKNENQPLSEKDLDEKAFEDWFKASGIPDFLDKKALLKEAWLASKAQTAHENPLERVLSETQVQVSLASKELKMAHAIGAQFNFFSLDTQERQAFASKRMSAMQNHIFRARDILDKELKDYLALKSKSLQEADSKLVYHK